MSGVDVRKLESKFFDIGKIVRYIEDLIDPDPLQLSRASSVVNVAATYVSAVTCFLVGLPVFKPFLEDTQIKIAEAACERDAADET